MIAGRRQRASTFKRRTAVHAANPDRGGHDGGRSIEQLVSSAILRQPGGGGSMSTEDNKRIIRPAIEAESKHDFDRTYEAIDDACVFYQAGGEPIVRCRRG